MLEPRLQRSLRRHHRHHYPCDGDGSIVFCQRVYVLLKIGSLLIRLRPNERITIVQTQLHVNETVTVSLMAVDIYGNPVGDAVLTNVQFNNSDETVAVSKVSEDGMSVTLDPVTNAAGKSTTLNFSATVGEAVFTGEVEFDVVAGPVAGVQTVLTFNPKEPPTPTPTP